MNWNRQVMLAVIGPALVGMVWVGGCRAEAEIDPRAGGQRETQIAQEPTARPAGEARTALPPVDRPAPPQPGSTVGPVDEPGHIRVEPAAPDRPGTLAPAPQPVPQPEPAPGPPPAPPPPVPQPQPAPAPEPHVPAPQDRQRNDLDAPDDDDSAQPAAQRQDTASDRSILAIAQPQTQAQGELQVRSAHFESNQTIPETFADYGEGISPQISWSEAPDGTESFVIIVEDPDAEEPRPFVHWIIFNIPADQSGLRLGVPPHPQLEHLDGARQGINSRGSIGYYGPRPPEGNPPHHYHFQVYALDTTLDLLPGATRDELLNAMKGHVLAKGETVGTFQKR